MKIKSLFISLCLIIGMALASVSAQGNKDTKSVQGWLQNEYWSPVYCDNQLVDILSGGEIRVHYVIHYKDGNYIWETDQLKGEVESLTGEVFKVREIDKTYFTDHWYLTWHFNLIGNLGTHYTGTLTYSYWTGEITIGKTECH